MSNSKTHIEIRFKVAEDSCEVTSWYAVTPEQKRAWEFWLAGQATAPSGKAVEAWLDKSEAKLDRADGPAVIMNFSDGSWAEEWWRDGNLHRVDGPAILQISADGSRREQWYTNNKLDRADGPAIVVRSHDGTILSEQWFHDDTPWNPASAPRSPAKPSGRPAL